MMGFIFVEVKVILSIFPCEGFSYLEQIIKFVASNYSIFYKDFSIKFIAGEIKVAVKVSNYC